MVHPCKSPPGRAKCVWERCKKCCPAHTFPPTCLLRIAHRLEIYCPLNPMHKGWCARGYNNALISLYPSPPEKKQRRFQSWLTVGTHIAHPLSVICTQQIRSSGPTTSLHVEAHEGCDLLYVWSSMACEESFALRCDLSATVNRWLRHLTFIQFWFEGGGDTLPHDVVPHRHVGSMLFLRKTGELDVWVWACWAVLERVS